MKDRGGQAPPRPSDVRLQGTSLGWKGSDGARSYAVYRIASGKPGECATADARNLIAVVPAAAGERQTLAVPGGGSYLVTSLDRLQNESEPSGT
jgi:hypothetical protein